jgi:hypothetical protein
MTDAALPAGRFAERHFNAGHVFNRSFVVFARNILPFSLVTLIASLPNLLILWPRSAPLDPVAGAERLLIGVGLIMVLNALTQSAVIYAAFDDMRGRPLNMAESIRVGLRRFFPALAVAISVVVLAGLSAILLLFPAFIVMMILAVAMPACIVERLGPIESMRRSARLTKGHRWKIFGLWIASVIGGLIAQAVLAQASRAIGGQTAAIVVLVVWGAVYGAFNAVLAIVIYHDLRVAKEGVDTDQIAAVFD